MKRIIYHHDDADGWASAAIIMLAKGTAKCIACEHSQDIELVKGADEVYVVDFAFSQKEMDFLQDNNKEFTWIDHHISAIQHLPQSYRGLRDTSKAACQLTWDYFFKEEKTPLAITHIADEDVWTFFHPKTKQFMLALENKLSKQKNPITYIQSILQMPNEHYQEFYTIGKELLTFREAQLQEQQRRGVDKKLFGVRARIFFSNINTSHLGNTALDTDTSIDIAVMIMMISSAKGQTFKYSLRSRKNGVDVSKIAQRYGGGGHAQAAGFETQELIL